MNGLLDDLGDIWRQNRHPVYNSLGHQVGSYESLEQFCRGDWLLLKGEIQPPNTELRIIDFWGRMVPAPQRCLSTGNVTTIAPPSQVQAQADKVDRQGRAIIPGTDIALPRLELPNIGDPLHGASFGTLAVWGGVGLLALVLILRRD